LRVAGCGTFLDPLDAESPIPAGMPPSPRIRSGGFRAATFLREDTGMARGARPPAIGLDTSGEGWRCAFPLATLFRSAATLC
jgi:hypothetical protein